MKKAILVLVATLIFTLLFYNESVGLNLSILGFVLIGLVIYKFPDAIKSNTFKVVLVATILILISNVWIFGPEMFTMSFLSLCLVRAFAQYPSFKLILSPLVIPIQGLATCIRIFMPSQSINFKNSSKSQNLLQNSVAYVLIPFVFIIGFVIIYIVNSDFLSSFFTNFNFKLDGTFFLIMLLGFYLMFSFWDGWIYSGILKISKSLSYKINPKQTTFAIFPEDVEEKSGKITLIILNIMLVFFVAIYTYEQFFTPTDFNKLSTHTHQRVNSLIVSIIMAVAVLLYFFRDRLNFIQNNQSLKILAKIWIFLNSLLILITALKTLQYITHLGLTQMRLGVLWFLLLSIIGLIFTYLKIQNKHSNFYLIDKMSWTIYLGLVLVVVPNWSSLITSYNLQNQNPDLNYLNSYSLYNSKQLVNYYKNQPSAFEYQRAYNEIKNKQSFSFLSKELYYETIDLNNYPKPTYFIDQKPFTAAPDTSN